jgi:hypothetical protein
METCGLRSQYSPGHRLSILQRRPHALGDRSGFVVDPKRHRPLEPVGPRDEHLEPAPERVGGDPRFVRRANVLPARDDGSFDALVPVAGDAFGLETRSPSYGIIVTTMPP